MTKPRFNIIDVLVILAVGAVIAGGVWFFSQTANEANAYVYFTVEIRNVSEDFEDFIEIDSEVRDSVRNYFLGHVAGVRAEPAHVLNFDSINNVFVNETVPDRSDIYLTVRGHGHESLSEITVEGHRVTIGREMNIRGRGFVGRGFITELRTSPLDN